MSSLHVRVLVTVWLGLAAVAPCYCSQWLLQIYVDSSQTGVNDSSCWEGGYSTPCLSLNLALKGAQHYNHSIAILLQPGKHHLHSGSETQLRNMLQLAIVGNGSEGDVVITCQPLAGLAFFQSESIELRNVSMIGCGALQNSTSINSRADSIQYLQVHVAVQFDGCRDVSMHFVQMNRSTGLGIAIYNSVGMIHIENCYFLQNGKSLESYGGGGLTIEFSNAHSSANLSIVSTVFEDNMANSDDFSALTPSNNPGSYFGLGRGGGLSIVLREGAANNIVQLSGVRLERNTAQFGGGLYLALYGNTTSNTITAQYCTMVQNTARSPSNSYTNTNGGGGAFIIFGTHQQSHPHDNTVTLSSCEFTDNKADIGGGIAAEIIYNQDVNTPATADNKFSTTDCNFVINKAFLGSSAYFFQDTNVLKQLVDIEISSTNFIGGYCTDSVKNVVHLPCSGSVFLQKISLTMKDTVTFSHNHHSAVELHSASIEVSPKTQVIFSHNVGFEGGALKVVDCSAVIVNYNTTLLFKNNFAVNRGGAVYFKGCDVTLGGGRQCFVRHRLNIHPNHWKSNLTFIGNRISICENSIFAESVRPCIWPSFHLESSVKLFHWNGWSCINTTGHEEVCTGEDNYQFQSAFDHVTLQPKHVAIFPGQSVNLDVRVFDFFDRQVPEEVILNVRIRTGPAVFIKYNKLDMLRYSPDSINRQQLLPLSLYAECETNYAEQWSSLEVGPAHLADKVQVYIRSCESLTPWNTSFCSSQEEGGLCVHPVHSSLICSNEYGVDTSIISRVDGYHNCPVISLLQADEGSCVSESENGSIVTGSCPQTYAPSPMTYNISVTDLSNTSNLSSRTCAEHREGKLCGKCREGYGVAFNSPDFVCTECNSYTGWVIFLLLEIVPVFIMMCAMTILHVNITNGWLNGYVLYSQLLTLQFPGLGYPALILHLFRTRAVIPISWAASLPLTVYSIWNLNFLTLYTDPFCIPGVESAEKAIALQYLIAALPILFIIGTCVWIQLYNRGYRAVVYITRPLHQLLARFWQKFKIELTLIDTYAGLFVLSYMRFLEVSVKVLQYTKVIPAVLSNETSEIAFYYNANLPYFGWPHALLGVFAVLCLLVFVMLPVIVLLFYHFQIFQKCLSRCKLAGPGLHALVDAYQGCFKNSATHGVERRYFAGIFLMFRWYIALLIIPHIRFISIGYGILPIPIPITAIESAISLLLSGMVVLLRPYKKTAHNIVDFLILFFMAVLSGTSLIQFAAGFASISIVYLPFIVVVCYTTYHLFKQCCQMVTCKRRRRKSPRTAVDTMLQESLTDSQPSTTNSSPEVTFSMISLDAYASDDIFADRIINPNKYT